MFLSRIEAPGWRGRFGWRDLAEFCYTRAVVRRELKTLFCERFNCPPAEYEERAFKKCLYAHAKWFAPLIRKLRPGFFAEDFRLIQRLGTTADPRAGNTEIHAFRDANDCRPSFFRTGLRIRVSGRKAAALARELLSDAQRSGPQP